MLQALAIGVAMLLSALAASSFWPPAKYLVLAVGVGLLFVPSVMRKTDIANNYVPVVATVTGVSASCYLEEWDSRSYRNSRKLRRTSDMSCVDAESLEDATELGDEIGNSTERNTIWDDMHVKGTIFVSFNYVAPADNSVRHGTLGYEYRDYKRLARLGRDDKLPIFAHETNPALVERDYGRMGAFETD